MYLRDKIDYLPFFNLSLLENNFTREIDQMIATIIMKGNAANAIPRILLYKSRCKHIFFHET